MTSVTSFASERAFASKFTLLHAPLADLEPSSWKDVALALSHELSVSECVIASLSADLEAKTNSDEAAAFFKTFTDLYANAQKDFELRTNERGEVAIVARDLVFEVVFKCGETAFWFTRDLSRRLSLPAVALATFTPRMASSVSAPPAGSFLSLSGSDWNPLFSVSFTQSHCRKYTGWRPC